MADGTREPISDVQVGDQVTSYDPGSDTQSVQTVTATWPHSDTVVTLTLDDGSQVETTASHPWWDVTTRTYTRTDHLVSGDRLLTADGSTITVQSVSAAEGEQQVWNLTITGSHTYYVGDDTTLVHNTGPIDGEACKVGIPAVPFGPVDEKATTALAHIDATGQAPSGFAGGDAFANKEGLLPSVNSNSTPIIYREWDVNPQVTGVNRGGERLVTGNDGSAYYTTNHYGSFTQMR
jgi:guanyl-specific ribonuclease Sa